MVYPNSPVPQESSGFLIYALTGSETNDVPIESGHLPWSPDLCMNNLYLSKNPSCPPKANICKYKGSSEDYAVCFEVNSTEKPLMS